jgi:hypothetical protein
MPPSMPPGQHADGTVADPFRDRLNAMPEAKWRPMVVGLLYLLAQKTDVVRPKKRAAFEAWLTVTAEREGVTPAELERQLQFWVAFEDAGRVAGSKHRAIPDVNSRLRAGELLSEWRRSQWKTTPARR